MLTFIIISVFLFISFVLYCCIHNTTSYDKEINDIEQEKFLREKKKDTIPKNRIFF